MKKLLIIAGACLVLVFSFGSLGAQQKAPSAGEYGPQAPAGQGWFCPWCGQGYGMSPGMMYGGRGMGPCMQGGYGMGPGMMHRGMGPGMQGGYGMGPGMMHRGMGQGMHGGYGRGPGMMHRGMGPGMMYQGQGQSGPYGGQSAGPIDKDTASQILENYVAANPNLKVGDIQEKEDVFVARIVTQDGSLVEKIIMDKETGWIKPVY